MGIYRSPLSLWAPDVGAPYGYGVAREPPTRTLRASDEALACTPRLGGLPRGMRIQGMQVPFNCHSSFPIAPATRIRRREVMVQYQGLTGKSENCGVNSGFRGFLTIHALHLQHQVSLFSLYRMRSLGGLIIHICD